MRARSSWSISQFVVAKKLGGGYASTVHLAVDKSTGIQVAVKVYHRCKLSQLNHYQVKREVRIHACLDHPNILRLYAAFEDEVGIYLITEYASRGDVFGELDRRGGTMSEGDAVRQVLQPFMSSLRYLHTLNIIHRDIKPENLLMTASGELKVADFGLSIDITRERPVTRVGTLDYMAPEVVVCPDKCHPSDNKEKTHLHYTHLVDAWAVGVLAFELTVGRAPFDAGSKRATIDQILNGAPAFPSWLSEQARHFITWSLTKDAKTRPDVPQLAYHPWVTSHVAAAKPRPLASTRAVSMANLHVLPGGASDNHAHMEARHKALVSGHVGEQGGLGSSDSLEESEEEEQARVGVGGGAAVDAAVGTPAQASPATSASPPAPASPFAAESQQGAQGPRAQQKPPAPTPAPAAASGARGILESAAESLRQYVYRCQSANNLESLRAAVLMQPPEPSNACFEPGGRFYSRKAEPQQQAAVRPGTSHGLPPPAGAQAAQQQHQQQQHPLAAPNQTAPSLGAGAGLKPMAPLPPAAPAQPRPAPLQLVRMPGHAHAAPGGPAVPVSPLAAAAGGPCLAKQAPHASSPAPAPCASPAPITPEAGAPPRPLACAKGPLAALAGSPPRGGSQDSSQGSATAADLCSACTAQTSGYSPSVSDGRGSRGSNSSGASSPELAAPAPVAVAASELPADKAVPSAAEAAAAESLCALRGVLLPEGQAAQAAGSTDQVAGSWFSGLHCLNLKPSKA